MNQVNLRQIFLHQLGRTDINKKDYVSTVAGLVALPSVVSLVKYVGTSIAKARNVPNRWSP